MTKVMKIAAFAAVLVCLVPALPVQAQNNSCQPIRLLLQASLNLTDIPGVGVIPVWSGQVRGFLNNSKPLNGGLYGLPGPGGVSTIGTGQVAKDYNLRFVFDFGSDGKFVTVADQDVMPFSPGVSPHLVYPPPAAFGSYMYVAKVAPDSLVSAAPFSTATGNISISGSFLVNGQWPAIPSPTYPFGGPLGIWNAEINGRLCNLTQ
jgi:hypothetical protein